MTAPTKPNAPAMNAAQRAAKVLAWRNSSDARATAVYTRRATEAKAPSAYREYQGSGDTAPAIVGL